MLCAACNSVIRSLPLIGMYFVLKNSHHIHSTFCGRPYVQEGQHPLTGQRAAKVS